MEPVCFLCQEYETDIGHQTISCPKQFCKKCLQRGHFAMNCKTFCKDFVAKDEQLVKIEKEDDVTKTENCVGSFPYKVETKMENPISVKKDLVSENKKYDEFSKSEEEAIQYCLESMGPNNTKKRKVDSELPVEKALPLEEFRQKIIEKLSNDLVVMTENKGKMEKELSNKLQVKEIELQNYQSIYALIIKNQGKELETLRESKKKLEIELNDEMKGKEIESSKYQSIVVKRFNEIKKYQDQKEVIEKLSKKVEILSESNKEMEIKLHEKIDDKVTEIINYQSSAEKTLEIELIDTLSKKVENLIESKKGMEIELLKRIQDKETELVNYQSQCEKTLEFKDIQLKSLISTGSHITTDTFEAWTSEVQKQIITKSNKDLEILRESKEKMEKTLELKNIQLKSLITTGSYITTDAIKSGKITDEFFNEVQKQIIAKLNKELDILRESKEKMELELNNEIFEITKYQSQVEKTLAMKAWDSGVQKQTIEKLRKDLKSLHEDKEKMESELNDKLQEKERERQLVKTQFALKGWASLGFKGESLKK